MTPEERIKVLQGLVCCQGQWVPIEKKAELESRKRKKIEQGYVLFQGEWVTIDEKIARTTPRQPDTGVPRNVTIDNRQIYNIQHTEDNRSYEQHRHVHVDPDTFAGSIGQSSGPAPIPLPDKRKGLLKDDKHKRKLLPPSNQ